MVIFYRTLSIRFFGKPEKKPEKPYNRREFSNVEVENTL